MCVLYVYINKQNLEILRKLLDTFFKVCAITKIPSKIICGIIRYSETDMLYIVISKYVGLQRVSKFILIIRSTVHVMFQLTGTESCRREIYVYVHLDAYSSRQINNNHTGYSKCSLSVGNINKCITFKREWMKYSYMQ